MKMTFLMIAASLLLNHAAFAFPEETGPQLSIGDHYASGNETCVVVGQLNLGHHPQTERVGLANLACGKVYNESLVALEFADVLTNGSTEIMNCFICKFVTSR